MSKYDTIKEIIKQEYINTNASLKFLSEKYNVPYDTVSTWKNKYNWISEKPKLKRDNRIFNEKEVNKAKYLYENTELNLKEISEKINISRNTIQTWKDKYNWIKQNKYINQYKKNLSKYNETIKINDIDVQSIKHLYENTAISIPEIAKSLNISTDKVRSRIKKFNFIRNETLKKECKSNIAKNRYKNYDAEKLEHIRHKMSQSNKEVWKNRNKEDTERIIQNRLNAMNKKSMSEKQLINNKISNSVKNTWDNYDREKRREINKKLSNIQQNLSPEKRRQKIIKDRNTKHKNKTFRRAISNDNKIFDSKYEVIVYEFCQRNHIPLQTQIPIEFEYNGKLHITFIDFKINDILFECKGGHLLKDLFGKQPIPIEKKLEIYKQNHVILITDKLGAEIIPKPNSKESNGLKYLDKCPDPLIGVDIDLFKNPSIPYKEDRPKCFYDVRVDGKRSVSEAWQDEQLRWKMILNRINYTGGFINNNQILTAMNVTRNCKQPSWFDKNYAKELIQKYITSNIILDPFAGWGTRCDACKELKIKYYGWDLNKELVQWHQEKGRTFISGYGIDYGDANDIKTIREECSVFICPPYTDFEIYFKGQDLKTTQCEWLQIVMNNIPNAKEYLMVCKVVDPGFEKYIVEEKINKSHLGTNKEYVLLIKNKR